MKDVEPDPNLEGAEQLRQMIFQSVGAASTCWTDMAEAGVFKSEDAAKIGENLVQYLAPLITAFDATAPVQGYPGSGHIT